MDLHIGQRLMLVPFSLVDELGHRIRENSQRPCKVVYINRKHRYFTVEFDFNGQFVREAYKFSYHREVGEHHEKLLIW